MRQGAQGWCTGMTLRDGMGREVGEGFRMGNTYILIDSVLKSRDIILPTKVCVVKAMVFLVVMYGFENCTDRKSVV